MPLKKVIRNWAGNVRFYPEDIFYPKTETELLSIVNKARENGKGIKVVGARHSWTKVFKTEDWLINLDHYSRVLTINKEKKTITIQAGIRLKRLKQVLANNGLAMRNVASIEEQSISGLISTGTHGTGLGFKILSTQVVMIRMICSDGSIKTLDESDGTVFSAALLSLGGMGIISEVTLGCVTKFKMEEKAFPLRFSEGIRQMDSLIKKNEHVKFWWFPHTAKVMVYCFNRTNKADKKPWAFFKWIEDKILNYCILLMVLKTGYLFPAIIPSLNKINSALGFNKKTRIDRSDKILTIAMHPKVHECEYAIPVEKAPEAVDAVRRMIEENGLLVNFVLEVRFCKGDDCLISPAYNRDSCYIGATFYGERGWTEYMTEFEQLMAKYEGRPHWGKEFSINHEQLSALYPEMETYIKIRDEFDPHKMFVNGFLKKCFDLG